jgi:hypothetical protein
MHNCKEQKATDTHCLSLPTKPIQIGMNFFAPLSNFMGYKKPLLSKHFSNKSSGDSFC